MGKNNGINYNARTFIEVRTELINFVKQYYPDLFSDFNDASVGQMLLELNAAVADMLRTREILCISNGTDTGVKNTWS